MKPEIAPEIVAELLDYNPSSGELKWREREPCHFFGEEQSPQHSAKIWNSRNAGKTAFTSINKNGYAHGAIYGTTISAHKAAWAIHFGKWPTHTIDHIDGNRLNNAISNLRDVPIAVNAKNQKQNCRNTSGHTGVHLHKPNGKWVASIKGLGKVRNLGYFVTKGEALRARKAAEQKYDFHPNHGRKVA